VWPDVAFSCTDSGWTWPGVAQYLPLLAPRLAPQNLISCANVRPDRAQYRPETDLTTQRDGRIRENARRADLRYQLRTDAIAVIGAETGPSVRS